jgi:actin-related protein 3
VIGSCIKHIPLAGRDMTKFIMQFLRDRNEPIPPEELVQVAKKIKEKYSYVCKGDLVKEFESYDVREDDGLSKKFKTYKGVNPINGQVRFFIVMKNL